jgi:hypothetical protein
MTRSGQNGGRTWQESQVGRLVQWEMRAGDRQQNLRAGGGNKKPAVKTDLLEPSNEDRQRLHGGEHQP